MHSQITVSLRDEDGDILLARQVSTQPAKIHAFFQQLTRQRLAHDESFAAVLEVCGFNEWLIRMLKDYRCHQVILIQPEERKKQKTDRRDAAALSELLWVNRARLLQGKPVRGLRQVDISSTTDQENRRLTTLRKSAGQAQTRIILKIKHMLRRYNLQWEMPTKTFPTQRALAWLKKLALPEIDRWEMDHLLADLEHAQHRVEELEKVIVQRALRAPRRRCWQRHQEWVRIRRSPWPAVSVGWNVFLVRTAWPTIGGSRPAVAIAARPDDREVSPRPAAPRHGGYWRK